MSSDSSQSSDFDVVVVGGGPAGLTAALYTTRLGHDTAVVNRGGGRAAMMQDTHNVIGITEDVSGNEFLRTAVEQLEEYGTDYRRGSVTGLEIADGERRFTVETDDGDLSVDRVVLATGFNDERPDPPLPRTGRGLHYCLHCDAYMFIDESVYVMGHGDSAAHVAMIMLNFTDEVDLLLRGDEPTWSDETDRQVRAHPIDVIEADVSGVNNGEDGWLESLDFEDSEERSSSNHASGQGSRADGTTREYKGGFAMYGSNYNNALAEEIGADLNDDGTVAVDDTGRTSVDGLFAVGDLVPGHNQIPVAMGQGAKAGIDIHYDLREFPKSVEELEAEGEIGKEDVPGISGDLREQARKRGESDD